MALNWPDISQNQLFNAGLGLLGAGLRPNSGVNPFQAAQQGLAYGKQMDMADKEQARLDEEADRRKRLEDAWAGMFGIPGGGASDMAGGGMQPSPVIDESGAVPGVSGPAPIDLTGAFPRAPGPQLASASPDMTGMGQPARNPMLANVPQQAMPLLAALGPERGAPWLLEQMTKEPKERRIVQGADGYNYYEDTGERVLPNVEAREKPPVGYRYGADGNLEADPGWLATQLELKRAGRPSVEVDVGGGDKFGEEFAKATVARLSELEGKAQDAVATIQANQEALAILDQGIIAGPGADWRLQAAKLAAAAGFDTSDPVAATEAYFSNRAKAVATMAKNFGSGAGITEADREFAERAAGGDVKMTEKSLRRILEIGDKAARAQIKAYNDYAARVRKMRPGEGEFILDVEMPEIPERPQPAQIPPPAQRTVGGWYQTPKGRAMWTGEGWQLEQNVPGGGT